MRLRLALPLLTLLGGCVGWDADPMLAPVRGEAVTVGELFSRGYLIVDSRAIAIDCPPEEGLCEGIDAVYMGFETSDLAYFACPGMRTEGGLEEWRCRRLPRPYVPNGGYRPD